MFSLIASLEHDALRLSRLLQSFPFLMLFCCSDTVLLGVPSLTFAALSHRTVDAAIPSVLFLVLLVLLSLECISFSSNCRFLYLC